MIIRILCLSDSPRVDKRLRRLFAQSRFARIESGDAAQLPESLGREDVDMLVVDGEMLPRYPERWIGSLRLLPQNPEVVVLSEDEDPEERARLLRAGCLAVLFKGLVDEELGKTLEALVQRRRDEALRILKAQSPQGRSRLDDFVSLSPSMRDFTRVVRRVIDGDSSLLILGETGTGKERLARAIHEEGHRNGGPFLPVNCGALPETLLESELFGHEKGAFTGATRSRRGFFEQADGGTIFLDEIGEIPSHLQVRLLRVIEDRQVHRLGGERTVPVDVRIMAATNRDLEDEVRKKLFRPDLYYRLAVVTLILPPLRERLEDIPPLVESYFRYFVKAFGRPLDGISPDAIEALTAYAWPGNVRELINVIERAVLLGSGPEITLDDLPRGIAAARSGGRKDGKGDAGGGRDRLSIPGPDMPIRAARREVVSRFEKAYLTSLLRMTRGKIGESARRAGIDERSLYDLLKRHGLRKESFKPR